MPMQVSWIEPDNLRDLVGRLQDPARRASASAVELHTLPDETGLGARELGIEDGDLWLPDDPASALAVPSVRGGDRLFDPQSAAEAAHDVVIEESAEVFEEARGPAVQGTELDLIREKLRAIRERAMGAGLLAHTNAAEAVVESPAARTVADEGLRAPSAPSAPGFAADASVAPAGAQEPAAAAADPGAQAPPHSLLPVQSPFAIAASEAVQASGAADPGFPAPQGAIAERLEAFAAWADGRFFLGDLLVVDDHGDILWGDHAHAGLVLSAMMACKAALRSSALGAAGGATVIEQPISATRMLIVIPCETGYGTLSIAFTRDGALPAEAVRFLREALIAAVETRPVVPDEKARYGGSAVE